MSGQKTITAPDGIGKTKKTIMNPLQFNQSILYRFQPETAQAHAILKPGTVAHQSATLGVQYAEPLLVALDSMIRYAKAHQKAFESPLADDYVLGPAFLEVTKGLKDLLNGNGAVANERNITTDSKNNNALDAMFFAALSAAGFTEETANL